MFVVDASFIIDALLNNERGPQARDFIGSNQTSLYAPELLPYECMNVLRRAYRDDRSVGAMRLNALENMGITYYSLDRELRRHCWSLTGSLTGTDAAYVTLAQALGGTLVTSDRRLAKSAAPYCEVVEIR